ncbi:hypothetical protein OG883_10185 [Streptomyces sp. NBC_01142]|uniref:restriction endonuclease fold toxin-2 domain-containing protein n=1 Tax=Streptomyces sp. NBC_01142 TaxID=2975865 RepID=UPI00224DF438|nr:restriction endonuclease fold toxin-2 domain-containing protein [Streptomyces sp. NBC_01142]MCX4820267.1 hypothetical protein [Streptomyces sp. NBC_01142]
MAGYPEYEVPIRPGISLNNTLMVDGFRDRDSMAVEAKYDFLYEKDRKEIITYNSALNDPRNRQVRGVETVTNAMRVTSPDTTTPSLLEHIGHGSSRTRRTADHVYLHAH